MPKDPETAPIPRCWPSALSAALFLALAVPALAAPPRPAACTRVELTGKVNAGQEWKASLGEGWVLRVVPIAPGSAGYTGWDLVVDRDPPAGFPDALLLATPPYNSINEREVGTTYGLRAQDAIGWNPRSFRFLINPADFLQGQKLFLALSSQLQTPSGKPPRRVLKPGSSPGKPSRRPPRPASSWTSSLAPPPVSCAFSMPASRPESPTPSLSRRAGPCERRACKPRSCLPPAQNPRPAEN